jgi:pilus assembly protein CpaF
MRSAERSGQPVAAGEFHVTRQLPDGLTFSAVRPPAALRGHLLVVNKLRRSDASLDGLVRGGTISRAMATMLAHCMVTRANLLVVGAVGSGTRRVVDALVRAVPDDQRTVWLSEVGAAASLPERLAVVEVGAHDHEQVGAVESASALEAEHLIVPKLGGQGMLALIDAIGQGAEGVVLHGRANSLRQAIDRIGAELAAARPGLAVETARELLVSSFDIAIEVSRVRDGRQRVSRLAELRATAKGAATRDVFVFTVHRATDGESVEGTFQPTGVVPTIVEELAGRGIALDTSIFRRHSSAH